MSYSFIDIFLEIYILFFTECKQLFLAVIFIFSVLWFFLDSLLFPYPQNKYLPLIMFLLFAVHFVNYTSTYKHV